MSGAYGLIVGSGFRRLPLEFTPLGPRDTPYGPPSSALMHVALGARTWICLARHGESHAIAPHEINYRANVRALHDAGVAQCVAVNVVGTLDAGVPPGTLALPDQLIDYTSGRARTFGGRGDVRHVEFTEPFDPVLRGRLAQALLTCGLPVRGGVYGVTEGPRLETAAEIDRLGRDGCTLVGMTAMPEAVLARELGMDYACLALAVNWAAGRSPGDGSILVEIERHLVDGMAAVARVLGRLVD